MTEGQIYTVSDATRSQLAQLDEPLQIRGFFSAKTHPLLAPLAPQMRDLLQEFAVAGGDNVRVEVLDPVMPTRSSRTRSTPSTASARCRSRWPTAISRAW